MGGGGDVGGSVEMVVRKKWLFTRKSITLSLFHSQLLLGNSQQFNSGDKIFVFIGYKVTRFSR